MKRNIVWSVTIILGILLFIILALRNNTNVSKNPWIGQYEFTESSPATMPMAPTMTWNYLITIYQGDHGLDAHIKMDGFQTLQLIRANVWNHGDEIQLVFNGFYTDDEGLSSQNYGYYKKGDKLLTLKKQNDTYLVEWDKMEPILEENQLSQQYFRKLPPKAH